jgi:FkbM family methyltransferase
MPDSISLPFLVDLQDELSIWRYKSFYTKEPETLKWLEYVASYKTLPNLIDVGSNIGLYSMYLLSLSKNAKVISIEPFEKNSILQQLNLNLNGFSSRVKLITNPVSNIEGLGYEKVNDLRPGSSGYKLMKMGKESNGSNMVVIKTLDSILRNTYETFSLKIDTDGEDFEVLQGANISLRNGLIDSILIEATELLHKKIELYLEAFQLIYDHRFNDLVSHSDKRRQLQNKLEQNRVYTKESLLS